MYKKTLSLPSTKKFQATKKFTKKNNRKHDKINKENETEFDRQSATIIVYTEDRH